MIKNQKNQYGNMGGDKFWSVVKSIPSAPRGEITAFLGRYPSDAATILSDFSGSNWYHRVFVGGRRGSGSSCPFL